MLETELNHILHLRGLPISEIADDVGDTSMLHGLVFPPALHLIQLCFVVIVDILILAAGHGTDSWRPYEESHDVLSLDPTLVLGIL